MSAFLPERLDPRRAAAAGNRYAGDLSLSKLSRLAEMIEPDQGDGNGQVAYQLAFGRDGTGRAVVQGSVQAQLRLCCQRCTEAFDLPVAATFTLAVVAGFDEAAALPEDYDPLLVDLSGPGQYVVPRDLIEDELILVVPPIPWHPEGGCPRSPLDLLRGGSVKAPDDEEQTEPQRPNPFAMLTALKTDKQAD